MMLFSHGFASLIVLGLLATAALAAGSTEEDSTFFSTVSVEDRATTATASDGDLWPSCWGPDDAVYTANGDGHGFDPATGRQDIVVCRITGQAPDLKGANLAFGDAVGSIWTKGGRHNRKPTGMVCVDGVLYLAIQDLSLDFNDAPAASISRSDDSGRTWTWDRSAPMFKDYRFTTVMFLDYGKDSRDAPDRYVYAYGLDNNWRDSFNDRVPDPVSLYLARVPKDRVQDRSAWKFYAGLDGRQRPRWSSTMDDRVPVLHTTRRVYPKLHADRGARNMTVLSQGGVVYNKPLKRFIYTSWTEYTFEFYEAPRPWGPWRLFLSKDFGAYPWTEAKHGGYGASIPSKFISADGRTMYIQDNTFVGGMVNYRYSLRKMVVEPYVPGKPDNKRDGTRNLARTEDGANPIGKTFHHGRPAALNDGRRDVFEDDWDQEDKPLSWWGYTWKKPYRMNTLVYTSGEVFPDGGWFRVAPRVQVRQGFRWVDVKGLLMTPSWPANPGDAPKQAFTFRFNDTQGTGIRLIGAPGGAKTFTSIAELEVYYAD